jgi:hypothetical protein
MQRHKELEEEKKRVRAQRCWGYECMPGCLLSPCTSSRHQLSLPPSILSTSLHAMHPHPLLYTPEQKADEEAAKVYEEFVESFKGDDAPGKEGGVKAFVRGGVVAPGSRSHDATGACVCCCDEQEQQQQRAATARQLYMQTRQQQPGHSSNMQSVSLSA